jgi:hypothetical protein
MPKEPEIQMMSYKSRTRFFKVLLLIFIISLPVFIFYTTGYRINFEDEGAMVVTTGGLYITTDELDVDVYLDEVQVDRPRLFRSAYYIQNIAAGQHRVVVQGEGLHTWVKELPVDPYIVSEAAAFNMPVTPVIRPIPEYRNATGTAVFFTASSSEELFPGTTTTVPFLVSTSTIRSPFQLNSEYDFVESLFATTSATTTPSLFERIEEGVELLESANLNEQATTATAMIESIEFVERGDMRIVEREDELFATWIGEDSNTPHYFCVNGTASSTVAERFGEHVAAQIQMQELSLTNPLIIDDTRFCRSEIRIDRKWQAVEYYAFFPGSSDLIVLQLGDGLYVTEIDDRAWQNTQIIYPGSSFQTIVTDDSIYIEENDRYFELLTELPE